MPGTRAGFVAASRMTVAWESPVMHRSLAYCTSVACLSLFALSASSPGHAAEPHQDRCVVLVSVDGLASFYLNDPQADLPTLRRLAREGARADGLACPFPTVTWPNHTTLVTGVPPVKHGVVGHSYLDRQKAASGSLLADPLFGKN